MQFHLQVLLIFGLYALPAGISTTGIVLLGRKRQVKWMVIEFFYLLLPFLVWLLLFIYGPVHKNVNNLIEAFITGIPAGLLLLPRLYLPAQSSGRKLLITYFSSLAASLLAAGVYFFTPLL